MKQQARAELAMAWATAVAEEARLRTGAQPAGLTRRGTRCPVCGGPATLTDLRPNFNWLNIEDCPCNGFFVWMPLWDEGRLRRLTPEDRETLSERIRHLHGTESEAWLATRDGTVRGALILRTVRPDGPR
jgi:hypothetical protein